MQRMTVTRARGDTYPFNYTLLNKTTRLPVPLTGSSFTFAVTGNASPFTLNGAILDANAGTLQFAPSAGQMDIIPGTYTYTIKWTDANADILTLMSGPFVIE